MQQFIRYQRMICVICIVLAIAVAVAIFAVWPDHWHYATGWLWGVLGGLVALRLKVLAILRFARDPENPPVKSGFQGYLVWIVFLAAGVLANKYAPYQVVNVWMFFAGVFLPNVVLMADGLLRPQRLADMEQTEEDAGEA